MRTYGAFLLTWGDTHWAQLKGELAKEREVKGASCQPEQTHTAWANAAGRGMRGARCKVCQPKKCAPASARRPLTGTVRSAF